MSKGFKTLLQVNARVWLGERHGPRAGGGMRLGTVGEASVAEWKKAGLDAAWLMGVWKPSQAAQAIARAQNWLVQKAKDLLPDFKIDDIVASPYAITGYSVNPALGDVEELEAFRDLLHRQGMLLFLDFVPNHTAIDHPWVAAHPDYFIRPAPEAQKKHPDWWFAADSQKKVFLAHGRDPNFAPWTDTAQINILNSHVRKALVKELLGVAGICDGVRVDMASLLLNRVFRETWGDAAQDSRARKDLPEFWQEAIPAVKKAYPEFQLIAECYGDTSSDLLALGFDHVYDKKLLDDLLGGLGQETILAVAHRGDQAYRLVHFTENHDETRSAEAFGPTRSMAAALVASALPGVMLFQEGQREGWRVKLPVQLRRRPIEKPNRRLERFYGRLLHALKAESLRSGKFIPLALHPVETHLAVAPGLMAFLREKGAERRIAIANSGRGRGRAYAPLPPHWTAAGKKFKLVDELSGATEETPMDEVRSKGFLVDLSMGGHRLWKVVGE